MAHPCSRGGRRADRDKGARKFIKKAETKSSTKVVQTGLKEGHRLVLKGTRIVRDSDGRIPFVYTNTGKLVDVAKASSGSTSKQQSYRERLRAQGLRPMQIWVPDTRAPGFAEEARRQSLLANQTQDEKDIQDFIEQAMDWGDD